jgi:hypothetical protein
MTADEYKSLAVECVRLAQAVSNPSDKKMLLAMAETWLKLHERAEKRADSEPGGDRT